jgi:hypothetical protein
VNDANVAEKISDGSPLMPGFGHTMSEADIADMVSYLKSGECCLASGGVNLPANPWYTASEDDRMKFDYRGNLDGGPTGKVRSADGVPREGIMVQLIASDNNIRTTVYSNEAGEYEFPELPTGKYTLRIARPLRWQPYRRDDVQIEGAAHLDEIVLERVTDHELLPPTLDIMGQMSGAEWLIPRSLRRERLAPRGGADEPLPGFPAYLPQYQGPHGAGSRGDDGEMACPGARAGVPGSAFQGNALSDRPCHGGGRDGIRVAAFVSRHPRCGPGCR